VEEQPCLPTRWLQPVDSFIVSRVFGKFLDFLLSFLYVSFQDMHSLL
jgi:hypothetical protein